jgi:hypothetical protein
MHWVVCLEVAEGVELLWLGVEPLSFAVQEEVKVISVLLQDQATAEQQRR